MKCDKRVLSAVSDFFDQKIKGFEQLQNPLVFDYTEFKLTTIQKFLNEVYNVGHDPELKSKKFKWAELIELVKFLKSEGKNMVSGSEWKCWLSALQATIFYSLVDFEKNYCENIVIGIRNKAFLENDSREEALLTLTLVFIIVQRFDNPDEQGLGEILYDELYEMPISDQILPYIFPQYKKCSRLEEKLMNLEVDLDQLKQHQLKRFYLLLTEDFFPLPTEFESRKVLVELILGREIAEDDEDGALEDVELIVWRAGKKLIEKITGKVIEAMDRIEELRPARNNGWGREEVVPHW